MIFLNDNYGHLKHKDVLSSEAFYPYRHDIGMSFEKVFVDENSLRKARELLEIEFTKLSRKNPKSDSYVYLRAFKILKEFQTAEKVYKVGDTFLHNDKRVINFLRTNKII